MFDFFVERAIRVVINAQEEAHRLNHPFMGTDHLLLGLMAAEPNIAADTLKSLGMTLTAAQIAVEDMIGKGSTRVSKDIQFTPRCRQVLAQSLKEAQQLGKNAVDAEHLLLAMLWDEDGSAMRVLSKLGVDCNKLRADLVEAISGAKPIPTDKQPKLVKTPILNRCGVNLTELATLGRLDPVIGRHEEIERMIQILSRRTKNNPILIGEPGVGKTALAEGLAQRIIDRDLPESFHNRQVMTLNVGSLLAGTKYRGEFEERLKTIMVELRSAGNVILVIDEVHTLIGAGSPEGSLDAANILKPALARGELQCIGATTLDEYRQHFERDAALARRFQPVMIGEPSIDEAVLILQGLRSCYERHHHLTISDLALEAAVKFSNRYISDRFLPDKAIDLIDEAGSRVHILSAKQQSFTSKDLSKALQQISKKKDDAIQKQEFAQASALQGQEIELMKKIDPVVQDASVSRSGSVVSEADIAYVVSSWTGIPVSKLTESESDQLLHMEEILHRRLIGQTEAVKAIARATRRARAGLQNPNRPIASFIFAGPTGVGKTELVKALAISFFGAEAAMVRLDMSEYMERHTIAKLIGSPPGYVGHGEGGKLTEAVRRKPYTVILLDEIEKAHPDVSNLLLQILDEGHLTDAKGRTVNFKNTLLVMTSNVGAKLIQKGVGGLGFNVADNQTDSHYRNLVTLVNEELKEFFRPEFLNRLDEVIVFRQLTKDEVKQIADILLCDFQRRLTEQMITLTVTDRFKDYLIESGYSPEQGARPLRRAITRLLEDSLAEAILSRQVQAGDAVIIDIDDNNDVQILREGVTTDVVPR
ncbi:ATPase with chaperone activity, ATP-binding subunit [Leptolyngbya sp. PCC 7375]|nr:ATPase with chaperone activity, ATP-binding subunit [Leptolyngbya sp. PCC 7375]